MKTSTDLHDVKENLAEFTWGEIIKFYELEEYTIASFYPKWNDVKNEERKSYHKGKRIYFYAWVNKKSVGMHFNTLEEAIVGGIAYKHEGPNSQALLYFMRMITE